MEIGGALEDFLTQRSHLREFLVQLLVFAVTFVLVFGFLIASDRTRGPFRIDEAHKLSETYFLRLVLSGDFGDPAWFAHAVDRLNPPVGKYYFGLALLLHGQALPEELSSAARPDEYSSPRPTGSEAQRLAPSLRAARNASAFATAAAAGLLFVAGLRLFGLLPGAIAALTFTAHYLTLTWAATAVFDSLFTLVVLATILPTLDIWQRERLDARALILPVITCSVLAGIAFQTRLNGLVAAGAIVVCLIGQAILRRKAIPIAAAVGVVFITLIVGVIINPYYWADDTNESKQELPKRIVARAERQIQDGATILELNMLVNTPLRTPVERILFVTARIAGGWTEILLLLPGLGFFMKAMADPARRRSEHWFVLLWGGSIIGAITLWIPLAWPRYLFVLVPPISLLAAAGWSSIFPTSGTEHETSIIDTSF